MPRVDVPVQVFNRNSQSQITYTAANPTDDHEFTNDGDTALLIKNASGATLNFTVHSVVCSHGRTGNVVGTIPTGQDRKLGPYDKELFNQVNGKVNVDIDQTTNVLLAAVSGL